MYQPAVIINREEVADVNQRKRLKSYKQNIVTIKFYPRDENAVKTLLNI